MAVGHETVKNKGTEVAGLILHGVAQNIMETRYLVVDRISYSTTVVGVHTFRSIEAAVANRENLTDFVVAVEDLKMRPLNASEEMEYEAAILRCRNF
jgi:hypothetical protein